MANQESYGTPLASGTCGATGSEDSVTWTVYDSGADGDEAVDTGDVLVIDGVGEMGDYGYFDELPWDTYKSGVQAVYFAESSKITGIGNSAFEDHSNLQAIELPTDLVSIGGWVFSGCARLSSIMIPESVATIGSRAFASSPQLKIHVAAGNANYSSENGVLYNKDKSTLLAYPSASGSIVLPSGLQTIGDDAFYSCDNLTTIELPSGLQTIGAHAFSHCDNLTTIELPSGLQAIGDGAFSTSRSLTTAELPSGLQTIGDSAFASCFNLTTVELPEGLRTIGARAFAGVSRIGEIEIPASVEIIAPAAFYGTGVEFKVALDNKNYSSENGALYNKDKSILVAYPSASEAGVVEVPQSVTTIGDSAFAGCYWLQSLVLPDGLTTIGRGAFTSCRNLERIYLHSDLTSVDADVFSNCHLSEIYYPEGTDTAAIEAAAPPAAYISYVEKEDGTVALTVENVDYLPDGTEDIKVTDNVKGKPVSDVGFAGGVMACPVFIPYRCTYDGNAHEAVAVYGISESAEFAYSTDYRESWEPAVPAITDAGNLNFYVRISEPADGTTTEHSIWATVEAKSLDLVQIGEIAGQEYSGYAITPMVQLMDGSKELERGLDYEISYQNNINVHNGTDDNPPIAVISGLGNYSGLKEVAFSIGKKPVTVTVHGVNKKYGEENPPMAFTVPEGALVGADTKEALGITLTTTATVASEVGEYPITGTFESINYDVDFMPAVMTVTQAMPYINAVPLASEITVGEPLSRSALSGGSAIYGNGAGAAGIKDGHDRAVAGSFAWKDGDIRPALADSDATAYTVVFMPEDTKNYAIAEAKVTLKVKKGEGAPIPPGGSGAEGQEPPAQAEKPWKFSDVAEVASEWKYESVKYVYNKGLMADVGGSGQFQPDNPLTRAMFATVLYRMAGEPAVTYAGKFSEVPDGKWFSSAILWANHQGIVDGYMDGSYGINHNITREQIAKMLCLYGEMKGYDVGGRAGLDKFTDREEVSGWATGYIQWAVDAGMIGGKPNADGTVRIDPKGEATRAECAKMLSMFLQKYE